MVTLAWPVVALVALYVVWSFLQAYLRGLRSERQVLAHASDVHRKDIVTLNAHFESLFKDVGGLGGQCADLEAKLKKLEARIPEQGFGSHIGPGRRSI
jgi:hypothetical protein